VNSGGVIFMGKLVIVGGQKLSGELTVDGAKNSVLPILAATILNGGINIIKNCPKLRDVDVMIEILKELGCKVKIEDDTICIDSSSINNTVVPEELAAEMRSSIIFLGPIVTRFGKATISYPGGCEIVLAHKKAAFHMPLKL